MRRACQGREGGGVQRLFSGRKRRVDSVAKKVRSYSIGGKEKKKQSPKNQMDSLFFLFVFFFFFFDYSSLLSHLFCRLPAEGTRKGGCIAERGSSTTRSEGKKREEPSSDSGEGYGFREKKHGTFPVMCK